MNSNVLMYVSVKCFGKSSAGSSSSYATWSYWLSESQSGKICRLFAGWKILSLPTQVCTFPLLDGEVEELGEVTGCHGKGVHDGPYKCGGKMVTEVTLGPRTGESALLVLLAEWGSTRLDFLKALPPFVSWTLVQLRHRPKQFLNCNQIDYGIWRR